MKRRMYYRSTTGDEGKKWNERRRRGLYEARISRHEIAATRENLRGLIMGRRAGRVLRTRRENGERKKEREREGEGEQVRDVRWAAPQGRASEAPYYFSLKQIGGQTAPLANARTSTHAFISLRELNNPRTDLVEIVISSKNHRCEQFSEFRFLVKLSTFYLEEYRE